MMGKSDRFREGLEAAEEYGDLASAEDRFINWNHSSDEDTAAYRQGFLLGKISQRLQEIQLQLIVRRWSEDQLIDLLEGLRRLEGNMDETEGRGV